MHRKARYRIYSQYLKEKYGQKVYKLPINLPLTCPNRDGVLSFSGCTFCGEEGAGFECLSNQLSVREQLKQNMEYIRENYKAEKFIAYFQNFTNTYMPLKDFKYYIWQAFLPDVVEIDISTRPDCIHEKYLLELEYLKKEKDVEIGIELGLQTVNYHTLRTINRGHTLAEFIDAVRQIQKYQFEICAHVILNLPEDNLVDVIETAKIISALGIQHVKLHSLYIVKGTKLAEEFEQSKVNMISVDEYIERVITFIEYLDPKIVFQRLFGRAPKDRTLFCNWGYHWAQLKAMLDRQMEERDSYQGKKFDYLGGKGVKKFVD